MAPLFAMAQKCSIKGNVFYKYNNFVGNRADAGCTVYLFYPHNSKHYKKVITDLSGNFSFQDLDKGQYLIAAQSKEVRQNPLNHIRILQDVPIGLYFDVDLKSTIETGIDSATIYQKEVDSLSIWRPTKKKLIAERDKKRDQATDRYVQISYKTYQELEQKTQDEDLKFAIFELSLPESVSFNNISLTTENPTANIIVDFGLTQSL